VLGLESFFQAAWQASAVVAPRPDTLYPASLPCAV